MALRLRVVSEHRRLLGDRSHIVFGVGGGAIGRSADNDWVLPDPLRYVSAHHGRISFRQGHYYLEDLSTNGIYINDNERPLGRSTPHRLANGDLLRFGEYHVVVALEMEPARAEAAPAAKSDQTGPAPVPTSIHALRTIGRAAQTDIGAALNLDELLVPDPAAQSGGFHNAYGQSIAVAPAKLEPPRIQPVVDDEPSEEAVARRIAKLAKAAGRDPRNGASLPALYDVQSGLQAFCRGAGIENDRLPADAQTRCMHLAGQLLRESLVGLKDLERTRNEIRNRFRIELPGEADDPRPSFARMTIDELLVELFHQHETRRLDAVQWLREQVGIAKDHEKATAYAMRAAFVEFVGRLDPAELEARFERAARRGKAKPGNKAQYWELFENFYRNLFEMPEDHLPHTFVEAFGVAYKDYLKNKPEG
jgi:type VI secretion system FHA domain protein